MARLYRITYEDSNGFVFNEWFPTEGTAQSRGYDLRDGGTIQYDLEEVDVPWDHLGDLIHWLNQNPNTPTTVASKVRDIPNRALQSQVGGDHYKKLGEYQPWEVLKRWLTPQEFRGYMKGQAIAYLARERDKGGDQDVAKAEHYLRGLLELQE